MLIVFEGIDGTGKTTQIEMLRVALEERGLKNVVLYKQPGATELGNAIRDLLFHRLTTFDLDPDACSLLFLAAHLQGLKEVVIPALAAGKIVIADRWDAYSGVAFGLHGLAKPISPELVELRELLKTPKPDLMILLYGDADTCATRASARMGETHQAGKRWANGSTLERIQNEYFERMPLLTHLVDACRPVEQVHAKILELVTSFFDSH